MNEYKYALDKTLMFRKDLKRAAKRGCNKEALFAVIDMLQKGEPLPEKNRDHALSGNWRGHRECHISPDWLLIYRIYEDTLILSLIRTGTHSDFDF